jgi:hypothetical protein
MRVLGVNSLEFGGFSLLYKWDSKLELEIWVIGEGFL